MTMRSVATQLRRSPGILLHVHRRQRKIFPVNKLTLPTAGSAPPDRNGRPINCS